MVSPAINDSSSVLPRAGGKKYARPPCGTKSRRTGTRQTNTGQTPCETSPPGMPRFQCAPARSYTWNLKTAYVFGKMVKKQAGVELQSFLPFFIPALHRWTEAEQW